MHKCRPHELSSIFYGARCTWKSFLIACRHGDYFHPNFHQTVSLPVKRAVNLLKTKRNLLYIRSQFVPRSKQFPPRL
jgi:hypothetical protein